MKPIYWYAKMSMKAYRHTTSRRECDKCFKPAEAKITMHNKYDKCVHKVCGDCFKKFIVEAVADDILKWVKEIEGENKEVNGGE